MTETPITTPNPTLQSLVPPGVTLPNGGTTGAPAPTTDQESYKTGIRALAALTGADPEKLGQELGQSGIGSLMALRTYVDAHKDQLRDSLTTENLQKLTPDQRKDVAAFYASIGMGLGDFNSPATPTETPEQKAERESRSLNQAAQSAGGGMGDLGSAFFRAIFMMIARALGCEDFANMAMGMMGAAPGGQGDGSFTGKAMAAGAARFGDVAEIQAIVDNTPGKGTIGGVVNLMNGLRGQHETGNNGGAIVQATMGSTGQAWCGGTVRFAFDKMGLEGIYNQADYRLAASYPAHAQQYNAYHQRGDGYTPHPGDVIYFKTSVGSGHVGIVTGVENGQVTYTAGNDGDAVSQHSFRLNSPPANLGGYTDTHKIAAAKGKNIDGPASDTPTVAPARAAAGRG